MPLTSAASKRLHMPLHEGDVLVEELLLQRLVRRADQRNLARRTMGEQVSERLPTAGGGFQDKMLARSSDCATRPAI